MGGNEQKDQLRLSSMELSSAEYSMRGKKIPHARNTGDESKLAREEDDPDARRSSAPYQ